MRAISLRTPNPRARTLVVGALVATLLLGVPGFAGAQTADPRVEEATKRTAEVQAKLDVLLQQLGALEAEASQHEAELAALKAREQEHAEQALAANSALGMRIRESYMKGTPDPTLVILSSGSVSEAREQARLLQALANRSRAEVETATAARTRTAAAAGEVEYVAGELRGKQAEIDEVRAEVATLLGQAQAEEAEVREIVAAEQRERERKEREERERKEREAAAERARELADARARDAQNRASRSQTEPAAPASSTAPAAAAPAAPAAAPAPVSGGVACPVGQPRNYSDTWGAARSGGRSHKGTDILAPRGTPIYAYESGSITRMNSNSLGGISLYMRGDSGTVYYYTHLQGYVSGLSAGQRVSVGQQIAYNGDTGNARGIPHLHFEVMPGGGGNVNPYPYVQRACG